MKIETFFTKEYESEDKNKNSLHVTKNLECHCCESSNAYELAEVGSNRNCAREYNEELKRKQQILSMPQFLQIY